MEVIHMLEKLSEEYDGKCGFYSVDVEDQKDLYNNFPLKGVPSILFFKDGNYKTKLAGKLEEDQVREKIAEMF